MRLEFPKEIERFGAIRFGGLQKIFELDSGGKTNGKPTQSASAIQHVASERLSEIEGQMAVVVPVRNERLKLVEGVLCGIPHPCLIIIVSNSPRTPIDRFRMEEDALRDFCIFVGKDALIAHQKDPLIADAFRQTGYTNILNKNGEVFDGKAEGMIIGTVLAWLAGKKYVGFVDADNYFPGSVEEYVRAYAAIFALSRSPYTMARIAWHSKPKIVESKLFFRKWGRTSGKTNALLNRLLAHYTGFETEIIKTGNAGEHAMSMELATCIDYSSGYSIEPYHIVNLIERFGGILELSDPEMMKKTIEVYQVESRNPHLHEAGDEQHIDGMHYLAMQVLYHSPVCPEPLRKEIYGEMHKKGFVNNNGKPARPRYFPPLQTIDRSLFLKAVEGSPYARLIKERIR
jgi:mannosyl-3-phosphoglycerate synthase